MSYDEVKEEVDKKLIAVEGMVKNLIASKKEAESKENAQSTALDNINQKLNTMSDELDALKNENETLKEAQQQTNEINQEIKEKNEIIERLTSEKEACEEKIKQIQEMLKMSQEESSGKTLVLEEQKNALQTRIGEIDAERNRLIEENGVLNDKLDKCQNDMKAVDNKLRDILKLEQGQGIQHIEEIINEKQADLDRLSNENTELQTLIEKLQKTIQEKNAANEMAKGVVDGSIQSFMLKQQKEEHETQINKLKQNIADKEKEMTARLEAANKVKDDALAEANKVKDDALAEADEKIKAAEEEKLEAIKVKEELEKTNKEINTKLELAQSQFNTLQEEKEAAELQRQKEVEEAKKAAEDLKIKQEAELQRQQEEELKRQEDLKIKQQAAYNEIDGQLKGIAGELGKIKEDKTLLIEKKLEKIEDLQGTFSKIDVGKISQLPEDGEFNKKSLLEKKYTLEKAINDELDIQKQQFVAFNELKNKIESIDIQENETIENLDSISEQLEIIKKEINDSNINGENKIILKSNIGFKKTEINLKKDKLKEEEKNKITEEKNNIIKEYEQHYKYSEDEREVNKLIEQYGELDNYIKNGTINNYEDLEKSYSELKDIQKQLYNDIDIRIKKIEDIYNSHKDKYPQYPTDINIIDYKNLLNRINPDNFKEITSSYFEEILTHLPKLMAGDGNTLKEKYIKQLNEAFNKMDNANIQKILNKNKEPTEPDIKLEDVKDAEAIVNKFNTLGENKEKGYSYEDGIFSDNDDIDKSTKSSEITGYLNEDLNDLSDEQKKKAKYIIANFTNVSASERMLKNYETDTEEKKNKYLLSVGNSDPDILIEKMKSNNSKPQIYFRIENNKKIATLSYDKANEDFKISYGINSVQRFSEDELKEKMKEVEGEDPVISIIVNDENLNELQDDLTQIQNDGSDTPRYNTKIEQYIAYIQGDKKEELRKQYEDVKKTRENLRKHIQKVLAKKKYGKKLIYVTYKKISPNEKNNNNAQILSNYYIEYNKNAIKKSKIYDIVDINNREVNNTSIIEILKNLKKQKSKKKYIYIKKTNFDSLNSSNNASSDILTELIEYNNINSVNKPYDINTLLLNDHKDGSFGLPSKYPFIVGKYDVDNKIIHVLYTIEDIRDPHLIGYFKKDSNTINDNVKLTNYKSNYNIEEEDIDNGIFKINVNESLIEKSNNIQPIIKYFYIDNNRSIFSLDSKVGIQYNGVLNKIINKNGEKYPYGEVTTTKQTPKKAEVNMNKGRGTNMNVINMKYEEIEKQQEQQNPNSRRKNISKGGENKISQDSMGSLSRKVHKGRRGGYRYSDLGMKGISIDFGELRKKQRKTLKAKKKKLSKQKKAKKHGKGTKRVKRKRVQSRRKK